LGLPDIGHRTGELNHANALLEFGSISDHKPYQHPRTDFSGHLCACELRNTRHGNSPWHLNQQCAISDLELEQLNAHRDWRDWDWDWDWDLCSFVELEHRASRPVCYLVEHGIIPVPQLYCGKHRPNWHRAGHQHQVGNRGGNIINSHTQLTPVPRLEHDDVLAYRAVQQRAPWRHRVDVLGSLEFHQEANQQWLAAVPDTELYAIGWPDR
jgi:hypothetical protein